MDRTTRLLSMFDAGGRGLEIGGSYNPLLRKSRGFAVETVDHTDAAQLRIKYGSMIGSDAEIEHVDHVLNGRPLSHVVTGRFCYDYIVASHVIEHTTDFVAFMADCALLLKPDGVLVLAVPDKRHCFDIFQPLTSTGELLDAHRAARTRHPSGKQFDHVAYAALRGGGNTWGIGSSAPLAFAHSLGDALHVYLGDLHTTDYADCHSWRFTPSSFRLIVRDLLETGFMTLREREFHPSVGPEFYISLSSRGEGCPVGRLDLMRDALREQSEAP